MHESSIHSMTESQKNLTTRLPLDATARTLGEEPTADLAPRRPVPRRSNRPGAAAPASGGYSKRTLISSTPTVMSRTLSPKRRSSGRKVSKG